MRFRARLSLTLLFLLVFPVLIALGFWQLDRAAQKEARAALFEQRREGAALSLTEALASGMNEADLRWRHVELRGAYLAVPQVLLDNQTRAGRAGYHVLSALGLAASGQSVWVDRGWVPAGPDRSAPPEVAPPTGPLTLQGVLGPPPAAGIALAAEQAEALPGGLLRVPRLALVPELPDADPPLPGLVLYLDADQPHGYARDWRPPGTGAERHRAYAVQWFSMAAVLLIIFVVLGFRAGRSVT